MEWPRRREGLTTAASWSWDSSLQTAGCAPPPWDEEPGTLVPPVLEDATVRLLDITVSEEPLVLDAALEESPPVLEPAVEDAPPVLEAAAQDAPPVLDAGWLEDTTTTPPEPAAPDEEDDDDEEEVPSPPVLPEQPASAIQHPRDIPVSFFMGSSPV